jgi:hypothetical protein
MAPIVQERQNSIFNRVRFGVSVEAKGIVCKADIARQSRN